MREAAREDERAAPEGSIAEKAQRVQAREGPFGGIYGKPFLARFGRVHLGGYMDWEFRDQEGTNQTFRLPRFIPFIYADVTDQIKVAAEIEIEFGGIGGPTQGGEVILEFAIIDYIFAEWIALRAGNILVPLGKFNLIHDSPVNDLTDRPLVDRFVIPTTFSESGIGFYGTLYPFGEAKLDYEIYLVNGFKGLVKDSKSPTGFSSRFSRDAGVRSGRPDFKQDINNSAAGVGRVAFSPFLGVEVGGSAHVGDYDEKAGGLLAAIFAVDATVQFARFSPLLAGLEYQGEFARARLERNDIARASGVPNRFWGMYHQINYHFMFDFLRDLLPVVFGEESTFTAVLRYDYLDLDVGGEYTQQLTPGINFRPVEDTVFKLDYQINWEGRSHNKVQDDAFLFSIATYF